MKPWKGEKICETSSINFAKFISDVYEKRNGVKPLSIIIVNKNDIKKINLYERKLTWEQYQMGNQTKEKID